MKTQPEAGGLLLVICLQLVIYDVVYSSGCGRRCLPSYPEEGPCRGYSGHT